MKTYERFLQESSLSRIVDKNNKSGLAAVSAERGDKSKKENKARSKSLEKDIRGRGMGMTKATGAYNEKDHGEVRERSYIVTPGKKGKKKFKKAVEKLGKKYDQDSVLHKRKPGAGANWVGTTDRKGADPKKGRSEPQGKLSTKDADKPLKTGEGGTRIGKKRFQFK